MEGRRSARAAARLARSYRVSEASVVGDRLRDARTLAGRTQAEIAGGDVTAAYVSRVETGQRKPDFHLLTRMAERAGTTMEVLLAPPEGLAVTELRAQIDHAELSLVSGDAAIALEQVERLMRRVEELGESELRARSRRIRALALEALGELDEAVKALEAVVADAPTEGPDNLGCLIALSRCYGNAGDIERSAIAGERARAALAERGLDGAPETIRLRLVLAAAYTAHGDAEEAIRQYQLATEAAAQHHSPIQRSSLYWTASTAEAARGAHQAAHEFARRALAYREIEADLRDLAQLRTKVALNQLRQNPPDPSGAIATLQMAKAESTWSPIGDTDSASQALARARAHFLLGQEAAVEEALAVFEQIVPPGAPALRSAGLTLAAQVAVARGEPDAARQRSSRAIQYLEEVDAGEDTAQLWVDLAGVLEGLGDTAAAITAFRRAADSTGLHAPDPLT